MGKVVWFTGLSGSGKTTIANKVSQQLILHNKTVKILDGDAIRDKIHTNLTFSREDIKTNNRLIAELAKRQQHDFVLAPIISPYTEDRAMVRNLIGTDFIELHINASLAECQQRDVKGLYAKANSGEINNMIGVAETHPYQPPTAPEMIINTDIQTEHQSVNQVLTHLIGQQKPSFSQELDLAVSAAKKAGLEVMNMYNNNFKIEYKEDNSPVTTADLASNKILLEELSTTGYVIVSEEEKDSPERTKLNKIWIIDPIDGTSDFIQHTGEFTIMIALIENQIPKLGVIYGPAFDVLYVWEKGKGAYEYKNGNWKRLQVNYTSSLDKIRIMSSRNHLTEPEKSFFESLNVQSITPKGSSYKAIDIASGNAELYMTFTSQIKQWDTAAYYGLVYEAGGTVTDLDGNPFSYNTPEIRHTNGIIISNGSIHQKVLQKYHEYFKDNIDNKENIKLKY